MFVSAFLRSPAILPTVPSMMKVKVEHGSRRTASLARCQLRWRICATSNGGWPGIFARKVASGRSRLSTRELAGMRLSATPRRGPRLMWRGGHGEIRPRGCRSGPHR